MRQILFVVLVFFPQILLASGIEFPDNGARAIGRGGAFAADPDDGFALQYNPAGFAKQRGLQLTIDGKFSQQAVAFTPADNTGTINNNGGVFMAPAGVLSYGFGALGPMTDFTVAIGAYGPSAIGNLNYPSTGAQRYGLINSNYYIAYYSIAAAATFMNTLSIGAAFQLAASNMKLTQALYSGTTKGTNPQDDLITEINVSGYVPTATFGITYKPLPSLAIGASYRPQLNFVSKGTVEAVQFSDFVTGFNPVQNGNKGELAIQFPDVIRLGVGYHISSRWLVEVNGVYERWSVLKQIEVRPKDVTVTIPGIMYDQPLENVIFPKNFKDSYSVRVGSDYKVWRDYLTVRAGYIYESSAIPDQYLNVDFIGWGRHVVSVGASIGLFGAYLDVGYAHHFIPTKNVSNSKVEQLIPQLDMDIPTTVVGNGTYAASLDVLSIALRVPFEKLHKTL